MANYACFLSCEHGGYEIPPAYQQYFFGQEDILQSHRGWDPGTLDLAKVLSAKLELPLVSCTISRLLIEMNRSLGHPQLYSEFTNYLSYEEKALLIKELYLPYRNKITSIIEKNIEDKQTNVHFSIHSFTPVYDGNIRNLDIGILFDPGRKLELGIAKQIKSGLGDLLPRSKIFFNEPYRGIDDGLTSYLRTKYKDSRYAGIEIEINQKWVGTDHFLDITRAMEIILNGFKTRKPVTK